MRIVDAHVHLWDVGAFPIPWFRDELHLPRVATSAMLRDAAEGCLDSAIAVQVADSAVEARWLTKTAAADAMIARTVLQFEPDVGRPLGATAVDGVAFSGVRAAVPGFAADMSDVVGLDELAATLGATGRVLELLIRPEQLPAAAALARRHPATTVVLCHLGLGYGDPSQTWSTGLTVFAAEPNAHAKFSGLLSPARTDDELARIAHTAFAHFGADRLMFGSDWPMSARTHAYPEVVSAVRRAVPPTDSRSFWSGTAERLYPSL